MAFGESFLHKKYAYSGPIQLRERFDASTGLIHMTEGSRVLDEYTQSAADRHRAGYAGRLRIALYARALQPPEFRMRGHCETWHRQNMTVRWPISGAKIRESVSAGHISDINGG